MKRSDTYDARMRKFYGKPYLAITLVSLLLAACVARQQPQTPASDTQANTNQVNGKLSVVVTFSVLSDLVQNVAGDSVAMTTLVGAGSDTHTFEPSPADSVALADATLIFENGAEFETWLDDLYTASRSSAKRVKVSEQSKLRELAHEEEAAGEAVHAGEHEHGEVDPHTWHDVGNVMTMVKIIRDALVESDPANASRYQANAEAYLARLEALDDWIESEVAQIPVEQRKLVTTHDTFGYFAERYGFIVVGTGMASISTESADPAAADVVALIEQIKAEKVPAIFTENVSNPELMERIAAEAGVMVAPSLYTDALGEAGSEGDSYIKMMQYNVTTIRNALAS